ncbi:hypothetical protein AB0E69_07110 [Kribbella sp. NPDC026611]|uniref:hypothetical protein n=1 Tax=Kribbella sp. NPDC026611 TaxID=3154911 RepID=UPI0033D44F5E
MDTGDPVVAPGLVRSLLGMVVLAGVFAMHALTMHHDPGMADPSPIAGSSVPMVSSSNYLQRSSMHVMPEVVAPVIELSSPSMTVASYTPSRSNAMSAVCLAVLATALLGLGLVLFWMRSGRTAPWWSRYAVVVPASGGRSPPWLIPSLLTLCVLRI